MCHKLGAYEQQTFSVLGAGKSKVLVALMSGETFFLIHRQHCLAMSSHEKAMAPHSSALAWKIPWTEEPGRLQSLVSLTVGDD